MSDTLPMSPNDRDALPLNERSSAFIDGVAFLNFLRMKSVVALKRGGAEETALTTYDWQDKGKGLIRLPIDRAMELAIVKWKNPAAARSNLISQIDKASAPAPKAPEKPSAFE